VELGVTFPQTEIGPDPSVVRDYAQAAEELGYTHLLAYDHVIGAKIDRPDRASGRWPYTHRSNFHEPFVLFGYLAGVTRRLGLVSGIVILPQRQTVLVAKQAAAVDVLSGGRLRVGVGLGWNDVEYQALGANFRNRGRRVEEQVQLMRLLWTQEIVNFEGRWHEVDDAGLNPLPVQRPIPLWMGGGQGGPRESGSVEPVLQRIGRLADGWILTGRPTPEIEERLQRLRDYVREAGRDPATFGLQGSISLRAGGPDEWHQDLEGWRRLGATHVTVNTMNADLGGPQAHIEAIRRVYGELAPRLTR
jgi:probable F420-dependent oxidoreductase